MHDSNASGKDCRPASLAITPSRIAFVAMLVSNICVAFGPWLVRRGIVDADIGPIAIGFWRLAIAAPVLVLLAPVAGQRFSGLRPSGALLLALAGLFFALDLATWHIGISHTKLANATLFGNASSFLFAGYGFIVARMWPGRNQGAALLLALVGVGLLLGRSYELSQQNLLGDLLCLLAGLFYTGYFICVDQVRRVFAPLPMLAIATVAGALALIGLAVLAGERIWPEAWTAILLLTIGSQLIGQGLLIFAMGHLSPVVVGLGLLTQPVIGAVIGWYAYRETMGAGDLIGAAMIGVALILVRRRDRPIAT